MYTNVPPVLTLSNCYGSCRLVVFVLNKHFIITQLYTLLLVRAAMLSIPVYPCCHSNLTDIKSLNIQCGNTCRNPYMYHSLIRQLRISSSACLHKISRQKGEGDAKTCIPTFMFLVIQRPFSKSHQVNFWPKLNQNHSTDGCGEYWLMSSLKFKQFSQNIIKWTT